MLDSTTERLTANFYLWERRGRGWDIWDSPVDLEPPFEPFYHFLPFAKMIDDGRKPTMLSSVADSIKKLFVRSDEGSTSSVEEWQPDNLVPSAFACDHETREFVVSLPRSENVTTKYADDLLLNLGSSEWPLSFEIVGATEAISVQFACREPDAQLVEQQLRGYFPDVMLKEGISPREVLNEDQRKTVIIDCGLDQEFVRPIRSFSLFDPDPLVGVYGVLEGLKTDESGIVQALFQAARSEWASSMMRSTMDSRGDSFFADAPEMVPLAREKTRRPLYAVVLRVIGHSPSNERAWEIAKNLFGALATLSRPDSNSFIPLSNDDYGDDVHLEDVVLRQSHRGGMILNSEELAGIVHIPSPSVRSQKLRGVERKTRPVPSLGIGHGFILGENVHQGVSTTVSLNNALRLRHIHIVGATGTGKSTLLLSMILQDLEQGHGCAVLDPHGDLIDEILQRIPEDRIEDVILFDPADSEHPVGFNILEARTEIEKNVLASDLVAIFRRFATSWGDQMTTVLGHAVSAFLEDDRQGTLVELRRFLIENDYRQSVLRRVSDPAIRYFWDKEFPLLRGAPLSSILTRLDIFLRPRLVRNIVGQSKGIDCEKLINEGKILLVKLAHGLIGEENAYLLGSLLISKIHQVVMGRQAEEIEKRSPFFLYLDEFQHFVTPSMATILGGARKFSLGLTLAHQDLRQLWSEDSTLASSVITNPGTRICFRLGDFDADKLKDGFAHFDASDLQNLSVGEAIGRIERKDYDFNLATALSPKIDAAFAQSIRERVMTHSRDKYGKSVSKPETPVREEEPPSLPPAAPIEVIKEEREAVSQESKKAPPPLSGMPAPAEEKKQRQHRYLQTLIKKLAEDRGYKAVIEEQTPDGTGRVDVGLSRGEEQFAVEISITTTEAHEMGNIQKCLRAGYAKVIVCSPEKKNLMTIKKLVEESLTPGDQEKVIFLEPEEFLPFFEEQVEKEIVHEERVKGYRVKVQYDSISEIARNKKDEAVKKVILQAIRRLGKA